MKYCLIGIAFLLLQISVFAQYNQYPILQQLYEKKQYLNCINKSDEILIKNSSELYPLYWQAKSYLALCNLQSHDQEITGFDLVLEKTLLLSQGDEKRYFKKFDPWFYNEVENKGLQYAKVNCMLSIEKSIKIHDQLYEILERTSVEYSRFKCLDSRNKSEALSVLETLVYKIIQAENDYVLSKEELIYCNDYITRKLNNGFNFQLAEVTKQVFKKSSQHESTEHLIYQWFYDKTRIYNQNTEILTLKKLELELKSFDSLLPANHTESLHTRIQHLLFDAILFSGLNGRNADAYKQLKEELKQFADNQRLDYCFEFFLSFTNDNKQLTEQSLNKVFSLWTDLSKFYQKLTYIDAIKFIDGKLQTRAEFGLAIKYNQYCMTAFPLDKTVLLQIKRKNELALLNQVKNTPSMSSQNNELPSMDTMIPKAKTIDPQLRYMNELLDRQQYSILSNLIQSALQKSPTNEQILALKKQMVIKDFQHQMKQYVGIDETTYFSQLPQSKTCHSGVLNERGFNAVLSQLNYVRRLTGLYDSCIIDPNSSIVCQQAALMMEANDNLSHHPPQNWKCYKKEAALVASNSNLSLGYGFNRALMGQMKDDGNTNWAVGHRRWILNPYNDIFGMGSTLDAMCLKVFSPENTNRLNPRLNFSDSQFVAWPSADYFPMAIAPNRWSFSMNQANFNQSKVIVTCNGQTLKLKMEKQMEGYALNTIVWILDKPLVKDQVYKIQVLDVVDAKGVKRAYQYQVVFLEIN